MSLIPNLWHLFVFREVVQRGGVSIAGEALGLTQPAVTQAVKSLNDFYSAILVERSNERFVPTAEGKTLLARADVAFALLTEGVRDAAGVKKEPSQLLRAMSARRLKTLISIVHHGSFSGAARAEKFAAPTVHRSAKDLEKALGVVLFESTSYGVRPTKQAEQLAVKAGLAFSELRQAAAEIESENGREAGRTVIGAMPLARAHIVPFSVGVFVAKRPDHKVSIIDGAYEDLLMALRSGEADILVGALRGNKALKDVIEEPLFDDSLSIVMRAEHPAASKRLTGKTLSSFPWVAPRATSPLRGHFEQLFLSLRAQIPNDVIECNSLGAARVLLMNSNRLMLLSDEQIRYEKAAKMLVSQPHPVPTARRKIGLTMRRNWRPTDAQAALVEEIRLQAKKAMG